MNDSQIKYIRKQSDYDTYSQKKVDTEYSNQKFQKLIKEEDFQSSSKIIIEKLDKNKKNNNQTTLQIPQHGKDLGQYPGISFLLCSYDSKSLIILSNTNI